MKRLQISVWSLLLIFQVFLNLPAQVYVWPTDASRYLTSSFCEFRPRHYHAAIDIKTWGKTGYKVFAIDDGYVFRIRVSSFGYGKAIYLKLKDGKIVVYAHLKRFNRALENYADKLRLAQKKYRLDAYLKPSQFPVKKGELIGFTGETGIGVPHLHFEIRDAKNRPMNPLQFYRKIVRDVRPPLASSLALIPDSPFSLINFSPDTLMMDLPLQPHVEISLPIKLSGKAHLALKIFDRANGVNNRFGFYKARMWINDSLVYQVRYDRFDYRQTHYVELDDNFSLWRKGAGVYHNFFVHPLNPLKFYDGTLPGSGQLNGKTLHEGLNKIRIELEDYFHNRSILKIPILYHRNYQVFTYGESVARNEYFLSLRSQYPLKKISTLLVNSAAQVIKPLPYQLIANHTILGEHHYFLSFPYQSHLVTEFLQLIPYYQTDIPGLPVYVPTPGKLTPRSNSIKNLDRFRIRGKYIIFRGSELPDEVEKNSIFYYEFKPHRYYAVFPVKDGNIRNLLSNSSDDYFREIRWGTVFPGKGLCLASPDSVVELNFYKNSVYDTFMVSIQKGNLAFWTTSSQAVRSLLPVYDVQPFDQPINFAVKLNLRLPDTLQGQEGLGIYYLDKKKGWQYLPARVDSASFLYSAPITSLEKFTVFQDTVPPRIRPLFATKSHSAVVVKNNPLKFEVFDEMSGIQRESQITIQVDGQWTLFDYDPEEHLVIVSPQFIPPGKHRLIIQVVDNVGNSTRQVYIVRKF